MKLPSNMTEQEVLDVIEKVVRRLAYKFRFGYHDIDDMKQQGRLFAIEGLEAYDEQRPLENFLWTHVRNRLFNFKRDKFERPDKPCANCPISAYSPASESCMKYDDLMECSWYAGWVRRNEAKKNLMQPIELAGVRGEEEANMKVEDSVLDDVMYDEIVQIIDRNLPIALRKDWLMCGRGIRIPKHRRLKLQNAVTMILEEHNIDVEEAWSVK